MTIQQRTMCTSKRLEFCACATAYPYWRPIDVFVTFRKHKISAVYLWLLQYRSSICIVNALPSHVPYIMGAIASVLQWHCSFCSLINPTERIKCIRCGTIRLHDKEGVPFLNTNSKNCTVIRRFKSSETSNTNRWVN